MSQLATRSFGDLGLHQAKWRRDNLGDIGPLICFPLEAIAEDKFEYDSRRDRLVHHMPLPTEVEMRAWRKDDFCTPRSLAPGGLLYRAACLIFKQGLRAGMVYSFPYEQLKESTFTYDAALDVLKDDSGMQFVAVNRTDGGAAPPTPAPPTAFSGSGQTLGVARGPHDGLVHQLAQAALRRSACDLGAAVETMNDDQPADVWAQGADGPSAAPALSDAQHAREARGEMLGRLEGR